MKQKQNSTGCIDIERHDNLLYAGHPAYEMAWDLDRGGTLVYLRDRRSQMTLLDARAGGPAPELIVCASATLEEKEHEIRLSGLGLAEVQVFTTPDSRLTRLEFAAQDGEIRIERTLTLQAESAWIEETVALRNVSDHDLLIDRYPDWAAAGKTAVAGDLFHWGVNPGGVDYILAGLRIGGDYAATGYVTPACGYPFFHNRGSFTDMGNTAISLVAGHHGAVLPCIMAYSEKAQSGVLLSCLHDRCLRYVRMLADQSAQTGAIAAQVWWARWLAPRERQEVATWHLVPFAGDYGAMLDEYRHWLATEHGIVPPADEASQLDELFVGCMHPVALHGLGHCDKLRPYVDAIRAAGCTAFWWGKPWLDAIDVDKRGWMSRCQPQTRDYRYAATTSYGGEPAVRALTDYIHAKGMKDIAWVTGYGLTVFDPLYREHPEMFIHLRRPVKRQQTEDISGHELIPDFEQNAGVVDEYVYTPFGGATIGADTTNPHWRKFWLHNQAYWTANGVDGIFFDSFNPMPPNYSLRPWPGQIGEEIINLQREARRLARQANPDFFSFTEGGGYLMATVNDFTHTWHGSTPPPLPPYRTRPLSPEEEARFLRDELLSMIPGARAWATVANIAGDAAVEQGNSVLPRVLFTLFGGRMPVMAMFGVGAQPEPIRNEPEYWTYFKARPANDPAPSEKAHWAKVKQLWQLRMAHPELKSGRLEFHGVSTTDPAVFAFLREKEGSLSAVVINFRPAAVTCALRIDWEAAGLERPAGGLAPRDLLRDEALLAATAKQLAAGYTLTIPARDGVVLKLQ
jgi:glycosidase